MSNERSAERQVSSREASDSQQSAELGADSAPLQSTSEDRIARLEKAMAMQTMEIAALHHGMAGLQMDAARGAEALPHARRSVAQMPDRADYRRRLADLYVILKQYDKALPEYQRLAHALPNDRKTHELLSACLQELGQPQQAQAVLQEYFFRVPYRPDGEPGEEDTRILKLCGVQNAHCRFKVSKRNAVSVAYRGGHFRTSNLVSGKRTRLTEWTIARGNITADASVPDHQLMVNTIADADYERDSLENLDTYLSRLINAKVINHPKWVLETARDRNYERLNVLDGITFPKTVRMKRGEKSPDEMANAIEAAGFTYPVILRETGTHTARTVRLAGSREEVLAYFTKYIAGEFYVIQFIDQRVRERFYNKKRVFCIDGALYPVVSHIDTVWNVHGKNRLTVMKSQPWSQDQEKAFVDDPEKSIGPDNYRRLQALYDIVRLDFFGIDFTETPDGGLLVFEVNPCMRHSNDHSRHFTYLQPHIDRISDAFDAMVNRKLDANSTA